MMPPLPPPSPPCILIIEDEPLLLKTTTRYLTAHGFAIHPENNPAQALETFARQPHAYAAILLDHDLPDIPGDECLRRIHLIHPRIPVIITTGYAPEQLDPERFQTARQILQKPIELPLLEHILRQHLPP